MPRHTFRVMILILALLMVAGCSSSQTAISRVTPISQEEPAAASAETEAATATAVPPTATPAPTDTAVPTAIDVTATATAVPPTVTPAPTTTATAAPPTPTATPTPLDVDLEAGSAREIALAQDVAYKPTVEAEITFDSFPVSITFDEFYEGFDIRAGLILSDKLLSLDGKQVVMEGYMAPPLKPNLDFFVLSSVRLAICPFCSTDSDWPNDIALIYMPEGEYVLATQNPIRITGQMEIGSQMDMESGMVSLVRIYADEVETLQ